MFTHSIRTTWGANGGSTVEALVSLSADAEDNRNVTIPEATNKQVVMAIDVSALKMLYVLSDKAVTFRTNANDGTADKTIALTAGVPLAWVSTGPDANPLGAVDVATVYIENAGATAATVEIRVLQDSTP